MKKIILLCCALVMAGVPVQMRAGWQKYVITALALYGAYKLGYYMGEARPAQREPTTPVPSSAPPAQPDATSLLSHASVDCKPDESAVSAGAPVSDILFALETSRGQFQMVPEQGEHMKGICATFCLVVTDHFLANTLGRETSISTLIATAGQAHLRWSGVSVGGATILGANGYAGLVELSSVLQGVPTTDNGAWQEFLPRLKPGSCTVDCKTIQLSQLKPEQMRSLPVQEKEQRMRCIKPDERVEYELWVITGNNADLSVLDRECQALERECRDKGCIIMTKSSETTIIGYDKTKTEAPWFFGDSHRKGNGEHGAGMYFFRERAGLLHFLLGHPVIGRTEGRLLEDTVQLLTIVPRQ